MDKKNPHPAEPATHRPSPEPRPDMGELTPPHGDEIVSEPRNVRRHETPPSADSDSRRPSR